jgi:GNAT superfamily N-acetyltransferase
MSGRRTATEMSDVKIRPVEASDRDVCGRILYDAFVRAAEIRGFRPDFPNPEVALLMMDSLLELRWGAVAEIDGGVVGSIFVERGDSIAGIGPITVDPNIQQSGVGRRLMQAAIEYGRDWEGIRLVQDTFNEISMSLYASLGFEVKEPLVVLEGVPHVAAPGDIEVRPLSSDDVDACAALCERVHGITRSSEVRLALERLRPLVSEREGRVTGYATMLDHWAAGHSVAETERDLTALLCGGPGDMERPVSFLLPIRQAGLFRWCLEQGLRIMKPMTLMTMGRYREPAGLFFPSVSY